MIIKYQILVYFGGINIYYFVFEFSSHIWLIIWYVTMQVNYIIIFNEMMKYNVKVNKTYKYNAVIAGILSMVI